MLDNSDGFEQNLLDIDKYRLNGYQNIQTVSTGSLWNVFIAENNGKKIIIKQINQRNIHDDEIEKKDIVYKQIRTYQFFKNKKRNNKLSYDIFYQFLGISFKDINDNNITYPIIIQNYAKNKSLENILNQATKNSKLLNDTRKMIIIYGIAKKMKALNENDLMHGNLKPSKILIDENYYPYINDVGSKMLDINNNNRFDVSYLYAAPETICGNDIEFSEKSDVFSFGLIVYHLLTGKKPYSNIPNISLHEIQLCWKRNKEFKSLENIPSFLSFLISLTLRFNKDERPTFNLIVEYFDHGIIFPSILKNPKEKTKFIQYTQTFSDTNFSLNSPEMLKRYQQSLNNDTFNTVVHFFLADYYNDLESQKQIARYYYFDIILHKDTKKALEYFQKAQIQKDAESLFFVGQIYFNILNNSNYAWKCIFKSSALGYGKATEFIENNTNYFKIDKSRAPVVLLTGKIATGKTTFIYSMINEFNNQDPLSTIGVCDYEVLHIENNQSFVFRIRDSMDMDRFGKILPLSCRDVSVCIIMYDVTNRNSFDSIKDYYTQLNQYCDNPRFILIGNKIDMPSTSVNPDEGRQKALDLNADFIEVSSKRGTNVPEARSKIVHLANEPRVNPNYVEDIKVIQTYEKPREGCC